MSLSKFTFLFGILLLGLGATAYTIRLDGGYYSAAAVFCVLSSVIVYAGEQAQIRECDAGEEDEETLPA